MVDTLGFIGLGNMGGAMVRRLANAGLSVHTYSRTASRYHSLNDLPLTRVQTSAEIFASCRVVMLNVTSTQDVEGLMLGPSGAIEYAQPGTVVIDFSTIDGRRVSQLASELSKHDITLLDCPVSGGVAGAKAGTLTIMAGGNQDAFDKVLPLLHHLGQTIKWVGPSGAGQAIKAANQMSMCIQLAGIAEAFIYAKNQGADLAACFELLSAGLAGSKVLSWVGPHIVNNFIQPATIESRLHAKDLKMVAASAKAQGMTLPLLQHTARLLEEMQQAGLGNADTSQLLQIIERHVNIKP